jgi:ERCC4-type nuclease
VQTLAVGDFQIGDRVLIERKRVRDFVDSLLDGRLLEQAHRLVAAAPRPLLLIEGGDLFMQRAVHMNALMGALATLTVDLGLPVVTTADGEETARFLAIAARREQALLGALTKAARQRLGAAEGGDESLGRFVERQQPGEPGAEVAREERAGAAAQTVISVEASEVSDTGWEGQKVILDASGGEGALATRERKELRFDRLAMLQSVPGVGPATADRLLARFESIAGVAAATVEELATVSGIGAAKAARILEVLNN